MKTLTPCTEQELKDFVASYPRPLERNVAADDMNHLSDDEICFSRELSAGDRLCVRLCRDRLRSQLSATEAKLAEAERQLKALVSASRGVVAADTYPMPGKTRFEATTEAIGKLEALLPQEPPACAMNDKESV